MMSQCITSWNVVGIADSVPAILHNLSAQSWQWQHRTKELVGTLRGGLGCRLPPRQVYLCLCHFWQPLSNLFQIPDSGGGSAVCPGYQRHYFVTLLIGKSSLMLNLSLAVNQAWYSLSSPLRNTKKGLFCSSLQQPFMYFKSASISALNLFFSKQTILFLLIFPRASCFLHL